jgi:hypothetical protein
MPDGYLTVEFLLYLGVHVMYRNGNGRKYNNLLHIVSETFSQDSGKVFKLQY